MQLSIQGIIEVFGHIVRTVKKYINSMEEYYKSQIVNLNNFFADKRNDKDWYQIYTLDPRDEKKLICCI